MTAKKHGRAQKADAELMRFKNAVRGTKNKLLAVQSARMALPAALIPAFVDWLALDPLLRTRLFGTPAASQLQQLEPHIPLPAIPLEREIRWTAAWLHRHSRRLNSYVDAATGFERSLLSGDYNTAKECLDRILTDSGNSLWLLRQRLALLQLTDGLKAQKEYLAQVRSASVVNGAVYFIAHYASIRVEEGVTNYRLKEQVDARLAVHDLSRETEAFLNYAIFGEAEIGDNERAGRVLRVITAVSPVDAFECLTQISRRNVAGSKNDVLNSALLSASNLVSGADDRRWTTLRCVLKESAYEPSPDDEAMSADFESFFGDPLDFRLTSSRYLPVSSALDLMRRGASVADKTSASTIAALIAETWAKYEARRHDSLATLTDLEKLGSNWRDLEFGQWLLGAVETERGDPTRLGRLAPGSPSFNVSAIEVGKTGLASYQQWCDAAALTHTSRFLSLLNGATINVETAGPGLFHTLAAALANAGRWSECIDVCALGRTRTFPPFVHNRLTIIVAGALIEACRFADALELITDAYMVTPDIVRAFPLAALAGRLGKRLTAYGESLALPIFFDLLRRVSTMTARDPRLRYASEDFLAFHNLTRPSELFKLVNSFDRRRLVHYLRHICTENVLDTSLAFTSSTDVAQERVAILKMLIGLDNHNREAYEAEMTAIVRRLNLEKRVQQIEESKIYVDTDGVRSKTLMTVRSALNQYRVLRAAAAAKIESAVRSALDSAAPDGKRILVLRLPDDEGLEVLSRAVTEIRDDYVASNEHGLNWYLSTRVRHGVLPARLRSPLQRAQLVTQIDPTSGAYRRNDYWLTNTRASGEIAARLDGLLGAFSKTIDELIDSIVNGWIQIRNPKKPEGMFNLEFGDTDVHALDSKLREGATTEELVDYAIAALNEKLDDCLQLIRERLENDAKPRFDAALTTLRSCVTDLNLPDDVGITTAITAAHTDVLNTFTAVSAWFRRVTAVSHEAFTIEEAIDTAGQVAELLGRPVDLSSIPRPAVDVRYPGRKFFSAVDIFLNLLKNAAEHSDMGAKPPVNVLIEAEPNAISVRVRNSVSQQSITSDAIQKVDRIREELRMGADAGRESGEGGSGFLKVRRALSREFGSDVLPQFGFDGLSFLVVLKFPKEVPE
jgi:hypothetical protein